MRRKNAEAWATYDRERQAEREKLWKDTRVLIDALVDDEVMRDITGDGLRAVALQYENGRLVAVEPK